MAFRESMRRMLIHHPIVLRPSAGSCEFETFIQTAMEIDRQHLNEENVTERCRKDSFSWFRHVKTREQQYVGRKSMEIVPPGRRRGRRRGRPKQRWVDCVNPDMRAIRTTKVHDRTGQRTIVSIAATPQFSGSG